jgi:hypothetical protein
MKKRIVLLLVAVFATSTLVSAKVKLAEGNLKDLKGTSKINVVFDYANMGVGSYAKEEDYVNKKKNDYNAKEPGRGDDWVKKWEGDRKNRFEPSFLDLFNKKSPVMAGTYPDAKYTMKVSTTFTEPGFNVYVTRKNASINLEITVYETADPSKVLSKIMVLKAPGRTFGGNDYDSGTRISEAYAKAGKDLAAFFKSNVK